MPDLILRTRVSVTRRNLQRVGQLFTLIGHYRDEMDQVLALPDELSTQLTRLANGADALAQKMRDAECTWPENEPEFEDGTAYDEIRGLERRLREVRNGLSATRRLVKDLRDETDKLTEQLKDVDDYLLHSANDLAATLTTENYLEKRSRVDGIFAEYVELLRGIALRYAMFGDAQEELGHLFSIADQLPRCWNLRGWSWQSVAVPSLQEREPTDAKVLRLGFPEWTVWALPFVQNAFAHVYIQKQKEGLRPKHALTVGAEVTALADALATLVTGPAYACAALLLRLDPAAVTRQQDEAALRSASVLAMLEAVSDQLPRSSPVRMLVERLRKEWCAAVRTAGGSTTAFDDAVESSLVRDVVQRATAWSVDTGPDGAALPIWADEWGTVNDWAGQLRSGTRIDLSGITVTYRNRPVALVLLLNAAWLARVGVTPAQDADDSDVDAIAARVVERMLEVARAGSAPRRPNR